MINWARVQELKDEIGEEDFSEIADMFMNEVEEVIERMRSSPDPAQYEADLHFLKSSALNLGFAELSSGATNSIDLSTIFNSYDRSKSAFLNA